jgi:hypothetical protein
VNFRDIEMPQASAVTSAVLSPKLSPSWQRCQRSQSLHHYVIIAFIFDQDRSSGWHSDPTNLNFLTQTGRQTDRRNTFFGMFDFDWPKRITRDKHKSHTKQENILKMLVHNSLKQWSPYVQPPLRLKRSLFCPQSLFMHDSE